MKTDTAHQAPAKEPAEEPLPRTTCSDSYLSDLRALMKALEDAQTRALYAASAVISESDDCRQDHHTLLSQSKRLGRDADDVAKIISRYCPNETAQATTPASLLEVVERPLLTSGHLTVRRGVPIILIDSEQPHAEKLVTLWHEVVHLLRACGGYSQDEASVEDAAKRLAAACPEALEWVGIHEAND